jgi:putative transposase
MRKTFKYRIYPNKAQAKQIDTSLLACQRLYNLALEQRIFVYKQFGKSMSEYTQINQLPDLKREYPDFKLAHSQVLQDVLNRLDKAYQNFFGRVKLGSKPGFPRFKALDRYDSFTLPQYKKLTLHGSRISLPMLGKVKIKYSRAIEGQTKTLTLRKDGDQYYVCISCHQDIEVPKLKINTVVGIDVGLNDLIMCSDGTRVENPKHLKKSEKKLKARSRKLSAKKKGSNNRTKQRKILRRVHRKIRNQRSDFLHKVSRGLIDKYDLLVFEDLRIPNMVKNHHLARAITDASWGTLLQYCTYKAEEAGKTVIQVDPRQTSKTCSHCGNIQHMPLWKREYQCQNCGLILNRDINAAKNILKKYGRIDRNLSPRSTMCALNRESSGGVR